MIGWLWRRLAARLSTPTLLAGLVLAGLATGFAAVARRWPAVAAAITVGVVLGLFVAWLGPVPVTLAGIGVAFVAIVVGGWLHWLAPETFDRRLAGPVRSWRRRRYYDPRWDAAMEGCELVRADYYPVLMSVRAGRAVDELLVHMAPGQVATDWRDRTPRLVSALEVRSVRVRRDGPRDVRLLVRHGVVDWRESPSAVDEEVREILDQSPEVAELVGPALEPVEPVDVPAPGRAAFPRRPR
jgi:hypothetical protein